MRVVDKIKFWAPRLLLALFFAMAFMWRCANIYAPQGGPRDTLPPKVLGITPALGSKNFKDKRITINFDEYIQLKDQQKEFFTSPFMAVKPLVTIRGRGIQIDIKDDSLKPNTTYSLNFGSSVVDNNEGNPLNGMRYVFSTGAEIDSLVMSGYAAHARTKDSVSKAFIYFYDVSRDSMEITSSYDSTLFKRKPDAVGRAENNGIFIAHNLKPIDYRVYAIEDGNNNSQYDAGTDLVAFTDSLYNPVRLPDFAAWYDTTRKYIVAEPQTYFKLFKDKNFNRQNLAKSARPTQHKVELFFNAAEPQISYLKFEGVDSSKIIFERPTKNNDTIICWLAVDPLTLPDTLKATITYLKHDSVRQLNPVTENLKLYWKFFEGKKSKKEREEEAEAPPVNPFKYSSQAQGTINPLHPIPFTFDLPLLSVDTTALSLIRVDAQKRRYRVRSSFVRDTAELRRWNLNALWQPGQEYQLVIRDSSIVDILGQTNDSIKLNFSTMDPAKYASLKLNVKGKTPQSRYIIEVLGSGGKLVERKVGVATGEYLFNYIDPGTITIRVTEDINGNDIWDSGDMILRRQSERVEIFTTPDGETEVTTKMNWELDFDIDMNKLFAPETMQSTIDMLHQREQARVRKILRDKEQASRGAKPQRRQQEEQDRNGAFGAQGDNMMTGGRATTRR